MPATSVSAKELPFPIIKAGELFQAERSKVNNYAVRQEIKTEATDRSTGKTEIEKRRQKGFFRNPGKFVFIVEEKKINGIKQDVYGNLEKSSKVFIDWLSKEGLLQYSFLEMESNNEISKFRVTPPASKDKFSKGELWIDKNTFKIKRVIQEPSVLKKGIKSQRLELFFEENYEFQEPSFSRLTATVRKDNSETEIKVEAEFSDYKFNIEFPPGLFK
ncbi:MAG: hypothetical protein K8R21_01255 [Leptospira sp.]|nr:hypothetical protein [Leptospira sp.]